MTQTQRLMTVMFTDVAGSARLYERLGNIEAAHAVDRCIKRITRAIEAAHGRTLQITGDELLAVFDSADEASLAAIDVQTRIADLPPVSGLKLTIRVGLHTGVVSEAGDQISGPVVITAARMTGLAAPDQILVSQPLVQSLSAAQRENTRLLPHPGLINEAGASFTIHELAWQKAADKAPLSDGVPPLRLCITYHGQSFTLNVQSPPFTLGRDLDNQLLIEDRKASRRHARIECRAEGFVYIDSSTNGSFLSFAGQHEILLRHDEIRLTADGQISFGTSRNDPNSDFMTFQLV